MNNYKNFGIILKQNYKFFLICVEEESMWILSNVINHYKFKMDRFDNFDRLDRFIFDNKIN